MNKVICSLFLIFSACNVKGQMEFAHIGAKWWHTPNYCYPLPDCGYVTMESIADTIIEGKLCKVIIIDTFGTGDFFRSTYFPSLKHYFFQHGDTIYHYDQINQEFYEFFNFSSSVGDTIRLQDDVYRGYGYPDDTVEVFEVYIDSIGFITIDSSVLRTFYTQPTSESTFLFTDIIYEKIGCIGTFFGHTNVFPLGGHTGSLRCYSDNEINYYASEIACDYVGVKEVENVHSITVSPNPCVESIHIQFHDFQPRGTINIFIKNLLGEMVREYHMLSPNEDLLLYDLHPGLYLLEIAGRAIHYTDKIVVQN